MSPNQQSNFTDKKTLNDWKNRFWFFFNQLTEISDNKTDHDVQLRKVFCQSLPSVRIYGTFSRSLDPDHFICVLLPSLTHALQIEAQINNRLDDIVRGRSSFPSEYPLDLRIEGNLSALVIAVPGQKQYSNRQSELKVSKSDHTEIVGLGGLLYDRTRFEGKDDQNFQLEIIKSYLVPEISILSYKFFHERRRRLFLQFPQRISDRYWEDSSKRMVEDNKSNETKFFYPPWDKNKPLPTASIFISFQSLYGLIEYLQSDELRVYSRWLMQLHSLISKTAHAYGGIIDRISDDSATIQFLEEESKGIYEVEPLCAAMSYAVALLDIIQIHLDQLKNISKLSEKSLSLPGIGFDYDKTEWNTAKDELQPNVVGNGKARAHRLSTYAEPGEICLSEGNLTRLRKTVGYLYKEPKRVLNKQNRNKKIDAFIFKPKDLNLWGNDKEKQKDVYEILKSNVPFAPQVLLFSCLGVIDQIDGEEIKCTFFRNRKCDDPKMVLLFHNDFKNFEANLAANKWFVFSKYRLLNKENEVITTINSLPDGGITEENNFEINYPLVDEF